MTVPMTEIEQPQAAAVVLDYRTGELKAIVGSRARGPPQRKTLNRAVEHEDAHRLHHQAHRRLCARPWNWAASPASVVYNMPVPIKGWTGSDGKDTWPRELQHRRATSGPETLRNAIRNAAITFPLRRR